MRVLDESHFHTPQQVKTYAADAVQIADELGLEGADRAALLPKLAELVAHKQVVFEDPAAAPLAMARLGLG